MIINNALTLLFQAVGCNLMMYQVDLHFKTDPELLHVAEEFAADNKIFLEAVAEAWTTLVNADMFDGPTGNLCKS